MKYITFLFIFVATLTLSTNAQKVLNETETQWVEEAQSDLKKAFSDIDMDDTERLRIIDRSAKTLKEYGQEPAWPDGKIPLQVMMDRNFEQCKEEIIEMTDWIMAMEGESLDGKMKLINTLQIEVVEEQVELLIPGNTTVQLSKDMVNTVFGINIAEGVNGGKRGDAQALAERFMALAKQRKLITSIDSLVSKNRVSLRLINADRKELAEKIPGWKQKYENAAGSAFTIKGYEGAQIAGKEKTTPSAKPAFKANVLVGTWKFGYEKTGYFYWTFRNDGSWLFEDKMNEGEQTQKGKYRVAGNTLTLIGPKGECGDVEGTYPFFIEDGEMRFKRIQDGCTSRHFTLRHRWERQ